MPRMRTFIPLVILAVATSVAHADIPSPAPYIGLSGGGHLVLSDWDFNEQNTLDSHVSPDSSATVKLRFGMQLSQLLALEIEAGWLPLEAAGESTTAFNYDADLLVHFMEGDLRPFVAGGLGIYHNPDGNDGADIDPEIHYGGGVRLMVNRWLAVRADARHIISDGLDDALANNVELMLGADAFFVSEPPPPPPPTDGDGDGIPDNADACPSTFGVMTARGCPDGDDDGIADDDDKCPAKKGSQKHGGCPDTDGDGIIDVVDACPEAKGAADQDGCPDGDGDGIADKDDKCPEVKGKEPFAGCPDSDDDGVADGDDSCPKVKGAVDHKGCPPPSMEVVKQFSGSLKGVNFESGTADLTAESKPILDGAAKSLKDFPAVRLRIEGHTDSSGDAAENQRLSEARAKTVKDYLVEKGVAADRLETQGLGPDKPIANNKTREGRAENRRIEFHLIK